MKISRIRGPGDEGGGADGWSRIKSNSLKIEDLYDICLSLCQQILCKIYKTLPSIGSKHMQSSEEFLEHSQTFMVALFLRKKLTAKSRNYFCKKAPLLDSWLGPNMTLGNSVKRCHLKNISKLCKTFCVYSYTVNSRLFESPNTNLVQITECSNN